MGANALTFNGPVENDGAISGTGGITINGRYSGEGTINTSGPIAINGPFIVARRHVFTGSGAISFGSAVTAFVEWTGVTGDDSTNNATAFARLTSAMASYGGEIIFDAKTYRINRGDGASTVNNLCSNLVIRGVPGSTAVKNVTSNGNEYYAVFTGVSLSNIEISGVKSAGAVLAFSKDCSDVKVQSCQLEGQYAPNDRADKSIAFYGCSRVRVLNNYFKDINFGTYIGTVDSACTDVVISGNYYRNSQVSADSTYPVGVYIFHGKGIRVTHNTFTDILPYTTSTEGYGVYEGDGTCDNLIITENEFYHTHDTNYKFTGVCINCVAHEYFNGIAFGVLDLRFPEHVPVVVDVVTASQRIEIIGYVRQVAVVVVGIFYPLPIAPGFYRLDRLQAIGHCAGYRAVIVLQQRIDTVSVINSSRLPQGVVV